MDDELQRTLSRISGGVYVLAARDDDRFGAATVAWATQVSFRPPLLVVSLGRQSNVFQCLQKSGAAALHIVGHRQFELARSFACPTTVADHRINGQPWVEGATAAPVLPVFPAHVECRLEEIHWLLGEHVLVVLAPLRARCRARFRPLAIEALRDYLKLAPLPSRRPVNLPDAGERTAPDAQAR